MVPKKPVFPRKATPPFPFFMTTTLPSNQEFQNIPVSFFWTIPYNKKIRGWGRVHFPFQFFINNKSIAYNELTVLLVKSHWKTLYQSLPSILNVDNAGATENAQ